MENINKSSKHITLATLGTLMRCYNCTLKRVSPSIYNIYYKGKYFLGGYNAHFMRVYSYAVLDIDYTYSLKRVNRAIFKHLATHTYA